MSNYKHQLILGYTCICLFGCAPPNYVFDTKTLVSDSIRRNISAIISPGFNDTIKSYRVFKAMISEKLVESDAVAELKLVNELSSKKKIDIVFINNRNELYFYEFTSQNGEKFGLLLSATFDASDNCLGVGPMYIGYIGLGDKDTRKFITEQEYAVRTKRSIPNLYFKKLKTRPELVFSYEYTSNKAGEAEIRVFEVMLNKKNKISGINKSVVFDVEKIFQDPDALKFSFTRDH